MKRYQITENNIIYDIEEDLNNTKHWLLNGVQHREDGPAIEFYNGTKKWYKNGKRHREMVRLLNMLVEIKNIGITENSLKI